MLSRVRVTVTVSGVRYYGLRYPMPNYPTARAIECEYLCARAARLHDCSSSGRDFSSLGKLANINPRANPNREALGNPRGDSLEYIQFAIN